MRLLQIPRSLKFLPAFFFSVLGEAPYLGHQTFCIDNQPLTRRQLHSSLFE